MKTFEDYLRLMRTHQQMDEAYEKGVGEYPLVIKGGNAGKLLIFVGSEHGNDPTNPQWAKIQNVFEEFKTNKNENKHVFIEGGVRPLGSTLEEMTIKDGDTGFTQFLAYEVSIPYTSPEPGRTEEVDWLLEQGFTVKQILAYYFARQLEQWLRGGKISHPEWHPYLKETMAKYATIHDWQGEDLSLDNTIKIYEEVYGHKLEPENRQLLNDESNPSRVPLVSACGQLRDRKLFTAIYEKWSNGYDVFTVYGSGHAIVLEPPLRELMKDD